MNNSGRISCKWPLVHDGVAGSSGESNSLLSPSSSEDVLAAHKPGLEGPWYVVSHNFSDEVDAVMLGRACYPTQCLVLPIRKSEMTVDIFGGELTL